ncbi:MAG: FAD-dependent oxidoreductase [Lachnospiraceae bacterium]|nr:FAD-dependent oxidoreductase [Lachnospiraceae bacterium]
MRTRELTVDFCVIGGGLSGLCAAIAAARHGTKTVLMHDRPMLGGNASSEIRMCICGARGENVKETGILEELQLENLYRNPNLNYSLWDSVLYGKAMSEPNLVVLLNCSCIEAEMDGATIKSVTGWQGISETYYKVSAALFADCSGDSILAPLTGAEAVMGREARDEYGESLAHEDADDKTMGMSCILQLRDTGRPQKFIPPAWANKYPTEEELTNKNHSLATNFWWLELGGEEDCIHDTDAVRHELLKTALGIWDHMKNYGNHGVENYSLEWLGFLPGKRESRRYIGDYILTQNDIEAGGHFPDIVGFGGWTMDDHFPEGFRYKGGKRTNISTPTPSPYGIPYRCLYSHNIENLFFAGRNISVTHMAMSSTRVMGTCAVLGQAVGTAASIAAREKVSPRSIYENYIHELQELLMQDDCYLPWKKINVAPFVKEARITSNRHPADALFNGIDRVIGEEENAWICQKGDWAEIDFGRKIGISRLRLVFDSDLNDPKRMPHIWPLGEHMQALPERLVKGYTLSVRCNGVWTDVISETENYQRNVVHQMNLTADAVRLTVNESYGADEFRVFSLYMN